MYNLYTTKQRRFNNINRFCCAVLAYT